MSLVPTIPPIIKDNPLFIETKRIATPLAVVNINKNYPEVLPAAGIVSTILNPPSVFDIARQIITLPVSTTPEMDSFGTSAFGTPIYANLEIQSGTWTDFNGKKRQYNDMTFNTVLLTVQQQKNIIETEIQGSDLGAVLEYSGLRNYLVTCDMILVGENGKYPTEAVANIIKMINAPIPARVNNWYLQQFDIYDLVVRDYNIPQIPGGISQQPVQITFSSSNSAILVIQ